MTGFVVTYLQFYRKHKQTQIAASEGISQEREVTCKSSHSCSTHSVGRHSKVLQVLQEADVRRDAGQVVVAEVQVTQLPAVEELGRNLLDLVPVQVEALQVGERADLDGDVGDLVVPELEAHQSVEMLEADDLLDGLQVVVFQIDLLQTGVDVQVRISEQGNTLQ